MADEEYYEKIRQKAINASSKKMPHMRENEVVSHGAQHLFVVGIFLFGLSAILFCFLLTGEIKNLDGTGESVESFLGIESSAGKLLKGLIQIVCLQFLFISLSIFYKAFMAAALKKEPDDFVDRVVDAIAKHLGPEKAKNPSGDEKGTFQSTLLVSLALAITVNVSVSVSNYFKQSDDVAVALRHIEEGITSERDNYSKLKVDLDSELQKINERNSSLQDQVRGQISTSNTALALMATATDTLRVAIENFDGISVSNSTSNVNDPIGTALNIENKVNIDNPDNREEIKYLNRMMEEIQSKNLRDHMEVVKSMAKLLCVKHEGAISWAKQTISSDERKNRLLCEKFKNEQYRFLAAIEEIKRENVAMPMVGP